MIRGMFQQTSYFTQLIIVLAVFLILNTVSSVFGIALANSLYHLDTKTIETLFTNFDDPRNIVILKMLQIIISLITFVLGSLLLAFLLSENSQRYLSLENRPALKLSLVSVLLVIFIFPFINFLGALNSEINFPNYVKEVSENNLKLMEAFLADTNPIGLFINIIMIGILPAIGEELFFRGIVQNIFHKITKNYHWGIWISAAVFSLIHMEFMGFVPRMVLGAMFGYMLVWSGSIWVPVIAHFINNMGAVLMYYLVNTGKLSEKNFGIWCHI
ncbi:MAG: CPBP family intramembrane metalloprotease [Bacteroidales bacterium]|nr:CPBP family intramembrane metalloprotease [Bacteroidales bacterium]